MKIGLCGSAWKENGQGQPGSLAKKTAMLEGQEEEYILAASSAREYERQQRLKGGKKGWGGNNKTGL